LTEAVDCLQFRAAIEAIRTGQPGAAVCDQFRAHIAACPSCAELFAPYRSMKCSDVADFLSNYFDGELETKVQEVFDFHVNACPECRWYLDSYEQTMKCARDAAKPSVKPPQALIDAILAARRATEK